MKFQVSSIRGTAVSYQLQPNWVETAVKEKLDVDTVTQADDIIQYKLTNGSLVSLSDSSCTVRSDSLTEFMDMCRQTHHIFTESVFESELVLEISQINLTYDDDDISNSHYLVTAIESAFSFNKCMDNNPAMRQYEITENISLIFFEKQGKIIIEFNESIDPEQAEESIELFKSELSEVQNQDVILENLE